jgi:hypothetical protein
MTSTIPPRAASSIVALALLAGCSSIAGRGSVEPSAYAAMNCNELNDTLAEVAGQISQTAINRGKVTQTNIPGWVPGGTRVAAAVTDRQTAKIERLQEQQRAIVPARDSACGRR